MKKIKIILTVIFVFGILLPNVNAQEKDQLWYCWEETVKPEKIDKYLEFSKELLELCKREKFPFTFFTWQAKPFTYELWSPISSLADIKIISDKWDKILEQWGEEKYAAFNETKIHNRGYTCTIKNNLQYTPANPDFGRNEFDYCLWIEVYVKTDKEKEFEEAVKWYNKVSAKKDYGSYVFYATGGLGYEQPCYIVMIADKSEEAYLKSKKKINEVISKERSEYFDKIYPLMRKPSINHDWYLLRDLSYEPDNN